MSFGLNREIERRANELMAIADREGHGALRIGGGWRSETFAYNEFFRRYTYAGTTKPAGKFAAGRLKSYPGDTQHPVGWYTLNPGEIPCATPGNSYHTTMPPDALTGDTGAVAIDWVNELDWLQANAHRVGLRASKIAGEKHHCDPLEYPPGRRDYNPIKHKLTVWPIQLWGLEMQLILLQGDGAILKLCDDQAEWVRDGNTYIGVLPLTGPAVVLQRPAFAAIHLKGPFPHPTNLLPTDFASWVA